MFARTARLMLRPGWPEDALALAQAIGHEAVVAKLAHAPWPYDLSDARWFLQQPWPADAANFLVFDDPDSAPRLVGGIAIDRTGSGKGELGYWFTPAAWGRGYATEAGQAVVAIAHHALGLSRLHARPFVDNPASARVLEKLGFSATGRVEPLLSRARGAEAPSASYELDLVAGDCRSLQLAA